MSTEIKMMGTVYTVIKTGQTENIQTIGEYLQFTNWVTQSILGNTKPIFIICPEPAWAVCKSESFEFLVCIE